MVLMILFATFVTPFGPGSRDSTSIGIPVPIRCDANQAILVPVAVNGSQARPFLLDTGASLTTIDIRDADRLGVATVGKIPSRDGTARVVEAELSIGSRTVPVSTIVAEDLKAVTTVVGKVAGILGSDALRALGGVTIDYDRCSLIVGSGDAPDVRRAARLALDWHEGRPVAPIAGGGGLLLDSGATTLTVFHGTRTASALTWAGVPSTVVRIERTDGVRLGHLGKVARVSIGSIELRNVQAVGVRSWYDAAAGPVPDGILPLGLFSRVHLDYRQGFVVFLPRSH